jgi:hypothetical protein
MKHFNPSWATCTSTHLSEAHNVLPYSFFPVLDDDIQGRHGLWSLPPRGEVISEFTAKLSP